jgi:hypothetical protein
VATNRWILSLPLAAMIAVLAACSSGSSNIQNPPPPPPSNVTIAFQPQPGASLAVGFSENLTATVTNDSSNEGVDWHLTCQNPPNCGALSSPHTASGQPTTYTAPSSISTNSTVVEIVALATRDQNKNVVAPITISTFNSSFPAGTYVLQADGIDPNANPYQFAAAIMLDAAGNIKNGEQTVNYQSVSMTDINLTGSYFLGNDGRGTITINTGDNNIGQNGVETFAFVYLSSSQALISQIDFGIAQTGALATGTMDIQTSAAAPTGGYAFVVSGTDVVKTLPVAFGGVFNIDQPTVISGTGSVVDELLAKKLNASGLGISGTLTPPDQFGAITLNLTAPFGTANKLIPLQFTGYIVDSTNIKLIETDASSSSTAPFGLTGGLAIGQGAATGTFSNSSFSGASVFGISGIDLSNGNVLPSTLTSVGVVTADGGGNLSSGFTDTFLQQNCVQLSCTQGEIIGGQISASFDGSYSVDSTGRASLTFSDFNPDPKHGYQPLIFYYLAGNGNSPLVLAGGDTAYPAIGVGIAYRQSSTPAFTGDYGFSFTQQNGTETDGTSQMNANATTMPPSFTGIADSTLTTPDDTSQSDHTFSGTFSSAQSNNTFTASFFNGLGNGGPFSVNSSNTSNGFTANYYMIDSDHGFWTETDLVNATAPSGQVSIGYYAVRTPVCSGCP